MTKTAFGTCTAKEPTACRYHGMHAERLLMAEFFADCPDYRESLIQDIIIISGFKMLELIVGYHIFSKNLTPAKARDYDRGAALREMDNLEIVRTWLSFRNTKKEAVACAA